jgi:hypothetical protein
MIDMFAFGRSACAATASGWPEAIAPAARCSLSHAMDRLGLLRRPTAEQLKRSSASLRTFRSPREREWLEQHLATCIDRVGQVGRRQDTGAVAPASFAHCSNAQLTLEREREVHGVMAMLIAGFAQPGGRPLGTERV